jgi:hypothetical protein
MSLHLPQNSQQSASNNDAYIECVSLIGTKFYFNRHLPPVFLRQKELWYIVVAFAALMVAVSPTALFKPSDYFIAVGFWSFVVTVYVALLALSLCFYHMVFDSIGIKTVLVPLVSLPIIAIMSALIYYIQDNISGFPLVLHATNKIENVIYLFFVEQIFLTLYISLGDSLITQSVSFDFNEPAPYASASAAAVVGRHTEENVIDSQDDNPPASDDTTNDNVPDLPVLVQIGDKSFKLADIRSISAEEHYVRVNTDAGPCVTRDKLSSVLGRIPDGIGFHCHRSHWVAFAHIVEIVKRDGSYKIQLENDVLLPLSAARSRAFRDEYQKFDK